MKIELHTIATYNDKEFELEELMNIILEDNNKLYSIIKEVREYVENNKQWYDKELGLVEIEGYKSNRIPIVYLYGLLEILDKVEKENDIEFDVLKALNTDLNDDVEMG